ncbi:MAG TPA: chemotaxis-specific protein-glutamate methyltransferase CheB [Stellaceae bacterium]|jgi:two-component system chemotaxis response regulator CheB|nr:chemotaxis-specific protein-glutamate methyltransferase CheB [Stellaceae bacterium]
MNKTRVLVVEDSLTVRRRLCDVLAGDTEIELVGEAEDGRTAIELCRRLRPDVVTMDMILPVMSGLAATEYIMAHFPTPILIVSSSFNRGEMFKTYDALAAGALDVLEKPNGTESDGAWERNFLSRIKLIARIRVITHPRQRLAELSHHGLHSQSLDFSNAVPIPAAQRTPAPLLDMPAGTAARQLSVLAIGASTGGPAAVVDVLHGLPATAPWPILLVLHINEPFGAAFAEWLDTQSSRRVAYPREGDAVIAGAGRVVMAPPGQHLLVRGGRLHLTHDPERHSCRPSVDVLFESVAREYGRTAGAVLLTGMGRDGAAGLLDIRRAGGLTIAQDEATSVVYGMPREAVALGAAAHVLPVKDIGPRLGILAGLRLENRA